MTLDTILVFKHAKKTYYILQIHNTNTKLKLFIGLLTSNVVSVM